MTSHSRTILALVALAAAAAGCSGGGDTTEPQEPVSYTVTKTASMWNAQTHRLEPVQLGERAGVLASIATVTEPPVIVKRASSAVWTHGGAVLRRFRSKDGTVGAVVALYAPTGGPPTALQTYLGHDLVSTNTYVWTLTPAGYVQTSSTLRIVRHQVLVGMVQTVTMPCRVNCAAGGAKLDRHASARRVGATMLYALACAGSSTARAQWYQMYWSACADQWAHYAADVAAFMAATAAMPESGPAAAGAAAVLATLGVQMDRDEQALVSCMASQPDGLDSGDGLFDNGASRTAPPSGAGDPSSSGSSTRNPVQGVCLEGSYAAHCQRMFSI
jgi:hypothetical protein